MERAAYFSPGVLGSIVIDYNETGKNIRRLMEGAGHTPQDLADSLSVSLRLVYLWLNGQIGLRPEHAIRISKMYDVPLEKIYATRQG